MNGYDGEQEWDAFPPGAVPPHVPPAYGPPPASGSPPGYGPAHGPPPGYGPAYGPPPGYGAPYPPAPWASSWSFPALAWPDGPARPSMATAAAVLGFVTAGLTLLMCLGFLMSVLLGEDDAPMRVLLLGVPCAAGLITGAVRLLGRRSPDFLFGSALASVAVLLLALLVGGLTIDRSGGVDGLFMFVLMASPLPVLTAIFARVSTVRGWAAAR